MPLQGGAGGSDGSEEKQGREAEGGAGGKSKGKGNRHGLAIVVDNLDGLVEGSDLDDAEDGTEEFLLVGLRVRRGTNDRWVKEVAFWEGRRGGRFVP